MNRRYILAALSSGMALSLAGCSGESDDEPEPTNSGGDGSSGSEESDGNSESESDGGSESESDGTDESTNPEQVGASIGELVEGDQLHLVIEGVEQTTSLGQLSEPDAGNVFVVVSLALKNVSSDYVSVSNLLQTRLRDNEDFQYDQALAAGGGNTFNDGQFAPGEVERGTITFEVPEDASGFELVFDLESSIFGGISRVTIDLESEANSVTQLEQSLQVDVYSTGEEIGFQDVAVAVNEGRTESSLGEFANPDSGNEFVIVDITITNNTGEERSFSTILQMMLKDGEGRTYQESLTAMTELDRGFDEGTPLSDGESRRGELAYEVPEGTAPLYWVFEFSLFANGNKTFWEIRS